MFTELMYTARKIPWKSFSICTLKALKMISKCIAQNTCALFHACCHASKKNEKPVRSEHRKFSYCGRTVQNSLSILFFTCTVFLN